MSGKRRRTKSNGNPFTNAEDASELNDGSKRVLRYIQERSGPGIVLICAEVGMGKTSILSHGVMSYLGQGVKARYFDFGGLSTSEAYERLLSVGRWCHRRQESTGIPKAFVALDNMPVGDEADVERVVALLRKLCGDGFLVAMATLPEGELFYEQMGEARCFWACDLCAKRPANGYEAMLFEEYSLGIPRLDQVLREIGDTPSDAIPSDPRYQELYVETLESMVRPQMMSEEQRLRVAMLLLGSGTRDDLDQLLGGLDDMLWRLLPRDAPFFGVDVAKGTFCCVGSGNASCLSISYATLSGLVRPWPRIAAHCARIAASREDMPRAAVVSLMCTDDYERCAIAMKWGPRLIDVGEVNVVADALEVVQDQRMLGLSGYEETLCTYKSLFDKEGIEEDLVPPDQVERSERRCARLAYTCRSLSQGRGLQEKRVPPHPNDDALCRCLVTHANVLLLLAQGRLREAHETALENVDRLEVSTISSAFVEIDFVLCSLLMGIEPAELDLRALQQSRDLFEGIGSTRLLAMLDASLSVGTLAAGRLLESGDLEAIMQRAVRHGDVFLQGLSKFAAGILYLRSRNLVHAHVRFESAIAIFQEVGAWGINKICRLLDLVVRFETGERVTQSAVNACKGVCGSMDGVVTMVAASISRRPPKRYSSSSGWGVVSRAKDVHWIVNVLMNDCGSFSIKFKRFLPSTWEDEQIRCTSAIDGLVARVGQTAKGEVGPVEDSSRSLVPPPQSLVQGARVEIHMMGGFEVYVEGKVIPGNRLDKRRSKALLALLAAVPKHEARRYMIMETVWPNYDYHSANKCVYSATSVLRSEIGALLEKPLEDPLIISNKAQGTVSLNMTVIACDVDVFEQKARQLLDMEGDDRDIVTRCREVEDLYHGDLFIPPTDGMGIIGGRSRQLRELFADAMISGSRSALRSGMKMLACRFARRAYASDDLREDAIMVLVASLCAAGRQVEAERCFERYAGHVADVAGRPPSRQLRESVQKALRGDEVGDFDDLSAADERPNTFKRGEHDTKDDESTQLKLGFDEDEEAPGEGDTLP